MPDTGRCNVSSGRLRRNLINAPDIPFAYLLNPKAGSRSLMAALARSDGNSKAARRRPPGAHPMLGKPVIAIVRNPYSRALSCYLSKACGPGRYGVSGRRLARLAGTDDQISFQRFLEIAAWHPREDAHWAPQARNLLIPHVPIDRLFHLERLNELWAFFRAHELVLPRNLDAARTWADHRLGEFYTPACIDLARRVFRRDFLTFGYSQDIAVPGPLMRLSTSQARITAPEDIAA